MKVDIQELTTRILATRSISPLEQSFFSSLLQEETLNEQEKTLVDRVFYGIRHGLLQVVDYHQEQNSLSSRT